MIDGEDVSFDASDLRDLPEDKEEEPEALESANETEPEVEALPEEEKIEAPDDISDDDLDALLNDIPEAEADGDDESGEFDDSNGDESEGEDEQSDQSSDDSDDESTEGSDGEDDLDELLNQIPEAPKDDDISDDDLDDISDDELEALMKENGMI